MSLQVRFRLLSLIFLLMASSPLAHEADASATAVYRVDPTHSSVDC